MRFFKLACAFGILAAVIGCASENWTWNKKSPAEPRDSQLLEKSVDGKYRGWVNPAGTDNRSRDIERSLGVY